MFRDRAELDALQAEADNHFFMWAIVTRQTKASLNQLHKFMSKLHPPKRFGIRPTMSYKQTLAMKKKYQAKLLGPYATSHLSPTGDEIACVHVNAFYATMLKQAHLELGTELVLNRNKEKIAVRLHPDSYTIHPADEHGHATYTLDNPSTLHTASMFEGYSFPQVGATSWVRYAPYITSVRYAPYITSVPTVLFYCTNVGT